MFFLKTNFDTKAQASLEYLLTLLAFFAFMLLIFPAIIAFYHTSVFALDVLNAKNFLNDFSQKISQAELLGNGTTLEIKTHALTKWKLSSSQESVDLKVFSKELGSERTLSEKIFSEISLNEQITGFKSFIITKQDNKIFIN